MGTLTIIMQKLHCGMQNKYAEVWRWNDLKAAAVSFQSMHYTSSCIKRKPTALRSYLFHNDYLLLVIKNRLREREGEKKPKF